MRFFLLLFLVQSLNAQIIISNASQFQDKFSNAQPGDTVFVRGGTYNMNQIYLQRRRGQGGVPDKMVTLKPYRNETVILKGVSRRMIIWANYVRIQGLTFQNWRLDIFGRGNEIIGNTFRGRQQRYGAIEAGGENVLIKDNTILFDGGGGTQDHGIYLHKGRNITVSGNEISGTSGYGVHLYDEHKSTNRGAWKKNPFIMKNYLITGNTIKNSRERSGLIVAKGRGTEYITLSDIVISNNEFIDNKDLGVFIRHGKNITVKDNLFVNNELYSKVPITKSGNIFENTTPPNPIPVDIPPVPVVNDTLVFENVKVIIIRKK